MGRTSYSERDLKALKKRQSVSALLILIAMPLTIAAGYFLFDGAKYMVTSLLLVIYTMIPFFMVFEKRKPKAREIVLVAMMTAITVVAHLFFHVTVPIQIGTTLIMIAGVSMGPEAGFLVGALSRFIMNFYMGQGPWTPWEMFAMGIMGFLAGLAFNKVNVENKVEKIGHEEKQSRTFTVVMGPIISIMAFLVLAYVSYLLVPGEDDTFFGWRVYAFGFLGLITGTVLQRKRLSVDNITLTLFTFVIVVIIYGGVMNLCAMLTASGIPGQAISINTLRTLYISGLPYDCYHALTAAIAMFVIGQPMIGKIERIKIKYGIYR